MQLRDYQIALKSGVYECWNAGEQNALCVSPTGSGKTAVKGSIFAECRLPAVAIAHRQELVSQISNALAEAGVYHRIIASKAVVQFCVSQHIKKFGRSYYNAQAVIAVAGIDTLLRRADELQQWRNQVRIWDLDEAHHALPDNKWGKGIKLFPHAWGVGFTATPIRLDRKSLGRKRGGVFDRLILGPSMRELIDRGYLADYIVWGPPQSIIMTDEDIGSNGDYSDVKVRKKSHESKIVGDIVDHYLKLTPGKLGITFVVDVETATATAAAFRQKGVPAEAVSGKTADTVRTALIEKFRRGELRQLINVDLFGEGMDVPAVEVVSMGRPTLSYGLYVQQFGRAMRAATGKTHGGVIDHVGNVKRHKLPDRPRLWSLEDEERSRRKKTDEGEIPVTTCPACFRAYEAVTNRCPYCGHKPEPASRSAPEFVDGDLIEYSPELLSRLRGEADSVMRSFNAHIVTPAQKVMAQNMELRRKAQEELRECIALWAGVQREVYDRSDSESYRRFYHTFGIDVLTAQTLGRPEAEKLATMIRETWI